MIDYLIYLDDADNYKKQPGINIIDDEKGNDDESKLLTTDAFNRVVLCFRRGECLFEVIF